LANRRNLRSASSATRKANDNVADSLHYDPARLTFQLEGKLAGPWVQELAESWKRAMENQHRPVLRFDLTGVTFVDAAGKAFLADRHGEGAEFVACGCLMRAVVAEIAEGREGVRSSNRPVR
jgi:hypothetical protein